MCGWRKSVRTRGDVSNWADANRIAAAASDQFGGIDILCANAGIFPAAKLDDLTPEGWDEVLNTNLKGKSRSMIRPARLSYLRRSGHRKSRCESLIVPSRMPTLSFDESKPAKPVVDVKPILDL
jgi:NAD(P)-dependent dehydrogenase (short-subunit alcohol dehydrogenase family)